jgi:Xaa-Pro dipeptidase
MDTNPDVQKMSRLKRLVMGAGIDALLLQLPENVCYTSDYWPLLGLTFVLFPVEGEPVLIHNNFETEAETWIKDVRTFPAESPHRVENGFDNAIRIVKDVLPDKRGLTIGFEGSFNSVGTGYLRYRANAVTPSLEHQMKRALNGVRLVDASQLMYEARMIKTREEYRRLKLANEVSAIGLETMYNGLREGTTELELATLIERETVLNGTGLRGAKHVMACAFVSSGRFTADTYGVCFGNRPRKMRRGDFVMLEFDVVVDGYSSDMSRTYVIGTPSEEQWRMLEAVYEAQTEAVKLERDGLPARDICEHADGILAKRGYGSRIKHYFGHGVGVTIWEPKPYIHSASGDILMAGMVHSAEPGVYVPHVGGVRIEDNVYLSDSGPVYLSSFMPLQQ